MQADQEINPTTEEASQPLTDWPNAPTIMELKQDFTDASASRDSHILNVREWLDHLHVRGAAKAKAPKGRSQLVPKLIRKQAEWRYAALSEPFLSTRELFAAEPVTWEDTKAAQQNQLVLNHQFNTKIDKVRFVDEYVRTLVDEGTATIKVLWDFEEEEYEEEVPDVRFFTNQAMAPLHMELAQLKETNFTEYESTVPEELQQAHELTVEHGIPVEPQVVGTKVVTKFRTVHNRPSLEICEYQSITVDPLCEGDINKARFVIQSVKTSLAELQKDGRYTNLEHINLEAASILGDPDLPETTDPNFNFKDKARKKFTMHEYWGYWDTQGDGKLVPFVAAWVGDVLVRMEENPLPHRKIPFVIVQYLPVRKATYGEPDGHLLIENQKVAGAVSRGMIDIMARSANGQTGTRKDALDAVNKRRFEQGQNYQFNPTVDPRQAVYMHTYPEIPQSASFMLSLQHQEAESLTGVKAFSGGLSGESLGDVATAVRGVLDAASKRELGILRRLSQGLVEIGRMIIAMNAEFLDEVEVVRITNGKFVQVRKEDLEGNLDLHLTISTAEEDNAKAQELAFLLQTLGNTIEQQMVYKIASKIATLRKMPDLAKELAEWQPQPDPMQEKLAELQLLKEEVEIQVLLGKVDESKAKAILDQMRAISEQAKARLLGSNADKADLDFVEQESGVDQERKLQLHGEQARSQMEMKLLDAWLDRKKQGAK